VLLLEHMFEYTARTLSSTAPARSYAATTVSKDFAAVVSLTSDAEATMASKSCKCNFIPSRSASAKCEGEMSRNGGK